MGQERSNKKEDWRVLKKYLGTGGEAVVIFDEDVAKEHEIIDGTHMSYDFGGCADIWIDIVHGLEHVAIEAYKCENGELQDEEEKENG